MKKPRGRLGSAAPWATKFVPPLAGLSLDLSRSLPGLLGSQSKAGNGCSPTCGLSRFEQDLQAIEIVFERLLRVSAKKRSNQMPHRADGRDVIEVQVNTRSGAGEALQP